MAEPLEESRSPGVTGEGLIVYVGADIVLSTGIPPGFAPFIGMEITTGPGVAVVVDRARYRPYATCDGVTTWAYWEVWGHWYV